MKYRAESERHKINFRLSDIITFLPASVTVSPWKPLLGTSIGAKRDRAYEPHAKTLSFQTPM